MQLITILEKMIGKTEFIINASLGYIYIYSVTSYSLAYKSFTLLL